MVKIAVIGGGWYGCYSALRLSKQGYSVDLYEAHSELFRGVSAHFANRLHVGPHYPRSPATRKDCQEANIRFREEFPDMFIHNQESIYCYGIEDDDGLPSRVSWETFKNVCEECKMFDDVTPLDCEARGFINVHGAFKVLEQSILLDEPRHYFTRELAKHGVQVYLNHKVKEAETISKGIQIDGKFYDYAVNCTYYQSLTSRKPIPYNKEVFYQPSLLLLYAQKEEYAKVHNPFSFCVMDGWFPSLLPAIYDKQNPDKKKRPTYFLYNAKYSMLGSFDTVEEGNKVLKTITPEWVYNEARPKMETAINNYYPMFKDEFEYIGYEAEMSAKVRSMTEFRSSVVWPEGRMIHVLSGKVSTIFQAFDEILALLKAKQEKNSSEIDELRDDVLNNYRGAGTLQSRLELNYEELLAGKA